MIKSFEDKNFPDHYNCKWCNVIIPCLKTKECNKCWELRHRIKDNIAITELILKELKRKRNE